MNRRTTLATLLGKASSDYIEQVEMVKPALSGGLTPYMGPFGYEHAAHLLRRTTFGPTHQQIKDAISAGIDGTLDQLFASELLPAPPLNHTYPDDPNVPIGQTWIDAPYLQGVPQIQNYRNQSLNAWTFGTLLAEGVSIREKMTLFWHNHFVISDINDPKFVYRYITLLRQNALGNFKELTKKVTIDPAMLRYLNGRDNTASAPNENYARELLELFTIGKGPVAGPGDYTNYTEDDIVQIARVLTGWRDTGFNSVNPVVSVGATFISNRHDNGSKQLSHRFDNAIINNLGDQEYAHLIEIIFSKEECARFICRKLYRWFVYYVIDIQTETEVIAPMAQILIENNYDIQPVLEALLRSEHFFDILNQGPMIKSPVDFVLSILKSMKIQFPSINLNQTYRLWAYFFRVPLPAMQQVYYQLPSVAGWKAYYQEPVFYRNWISSATLPIRMDFSKTIILQGITQAGAIVKVDVLKIVSELDDPFDPNAMIQSLVDIFFPQPISTEQRIALKEVLIPGLPDFEWTVEYSDYINNPMDDNLKAAVESKLRNLFVALTNMPEFYLS